jgi:hypothetical protein
MGLVTEELGSDSNPSADNMSESELQKLLPPPPPAPPKKALKKKEAVGNASQQHSAAI